MSALALDDVFLFAGFRLDGRDGLFGKDADGGFASVALGSRALDVLGVLVVHAGQLVSREAIFAAVWPGITVEDSNLNMQIAALRRVLDAGRTAGTVIQTIPGRGYRFTAPVTRSLTEAQVNATPGVTNGALLLPDKPSIAVLPFANMSGDPEQEYFADGMVEEIITALSRIRWLFVIARNSSFTYKGQAVDLKQVARELGVRYVLEGSVRKAGQRVRIAAQLIDATTGTHLWADRFDGPLEGIFELQDKVATSVAGVIEPTLQAAETARSADRPTNDLTAYDLYLRAYKMFFASATLIPGALCLLEQAIKHDPHYGPALAWAAVCKLRLVGDGLSTDPAADSRKSVEFARRALQTAGDDAGVLSNAALALGRFGEDIGSTITLVDRALAINPSFARGWYIRAILGLFAGEFDRAIEDAEAALRLSPRGRFGQVFNVIGAALLFLRRFDEALPKLLLAIQDDPDFPMPYRYLAACYAHMGRLDEAHLVIAQLRAMTSVVVEGVDNFRNPEHRAWFLSGLRLAAGEAS